MKYGKNNAGTNYSLDSYGIQINTLLMTGIHILGLKPTTVWVLEFIFNNKRANCDLIFTLNVLYVYIAGICRFKALFIVSYSTCQHQSFS